MYRYVSQLTEFAALRVGKLDSMIAKLRVLDYLAPNERAVSQSLVAPYRAAQVLAGLNEDHIERTGARHLPNRKQGCHRHKPGYRWDSFSS